MRGDLDKARRAHHSAEARWRRLGLSLYGVFTAARRDAMLDELDALELDLAELRLAIASADPDPEPIPLALAAHANVVRIDRILRGRA